MRHTFRRLWAAAALALVATGCGSTPSTTPDVTRELPPKPERMLSGPTGSGNHPQPGAPVARQLTRTK
jgi:hypothetical protein